MNELKRLKRSLEEGGYTFTIALNGGDYVSKERGIKPLLTLLDSGADTRGTCAADKVVGKAAAFIYLKLGISGIYALIISKPALDVLRGAGIEVLYDELTDAIKNRRGDGFCPMESAVKEISDIDKAIALLRERVALL